jgi:hypothetical protein
MNIRPAKLPASVRHGVRPGAAASAASDAGSVQSTAREPEDDAGAGADPPDLGWRSSSYDLKHGLDVVELPTTLPADVLDRLFNALGK